MQWEPEGGGRVAGLAGSRLESLIKWINAEVPGFNLPLETSEEELRACLSDGLLLCSILDKLVPGSLEVVGMNILHCVVLYAHTSCNYVLR